jgi:diaminohydroxyphosphoribosylaminopyrimidine deaminase / 5-amino-6-(5-phosphoribosylamino)uracil reductase
MPSLRPYVRHSFRDFLFAFSDYETPRVLNHSGRNLKSFWSQTDGFCDMMAIVALIPQPHSEFDSYVTISNFPVAKSVSSDPWEGFSDIFRREHQPLPKVWADVFGPLRKGTVDDLVIVGQLGQSLDGRIATETGHSKYINGPAGLVHLHRLRALMDVVVVGVGTAIADDPQLTVRRVAGPQPARVVIDPKGRLGADARIFDDNGARRLLITAQGTRCAPPPGVEIVALPAPDGQIAPSSILAALADCGMRRMLIEGGADTVSRFLAAGCLDRLHVIVAPIILGAGGPGLILPPLERADQAPRMPIRLHKIEDDVLFDCDLSAQRVALGVAKKST